METQFVGPPSPVVRPIANPPETVLPEMNSPADFTCAASEMMAFAHLAVLSVTSRMTPNNMARFVNRRWETNFTPSLVMGLLHGPFKVMMASYESMLRLDDHYRRIDSDPNNEVPPDSESRVITRIEVLDGVENVLVDITQRVADLYEPRATWLHEMSWRQRQAMYLWHNELLPDEWDDEGYVDDEEEACNCSGCCRMRTHGDV